MTALLVLRLAASCRRSPWCRRSYQSWDLLWWSNWPSIGWQGCIVIMAISAGMTLAATFFMLQETKVEREVRIRIGRIVRAYTGLMVNPTFMANGLTSGMAVAMFFVLSGIMPYQYERYAIGPLEYGVFFCLCSVGYMAGNIVNRRFVSTLGLELASFRGALISASGVDLRCSPILLTSARRLWSPPAWW